MVDEDDFIDIDDLAKSQIDDDILSVLSGLFSTITRGLKLKRVKGKESWVFKHSFRIERGGERYWKYKTTPCKFS